jgi:hypothetical protein
MNIRTEKPNFPLISAFARKIALPPSPANHRKLSWATEQPAVWRMGCDSAWEQEKLETRKMSEKPHRTHQSSARFVRHGFI